MKSKSISEKAAAFIEYKQSLGYVYDTQGYYIMRYLKYMEENYPDLSLPDKNSTDGFLELFKGTTGSLYNVTATLREFSRYLVKVGHSGPYIIPPKQTPKLYPEPPYFFSADDISGFFKECDAYYAENPRPKCRGIVIPAMFRLLYCCGLRPKEARTLKCQDVHLSDGYIDVIQSKGPKSRRVFISGELSSYLARYDALASDSFPGRLYFFSNGSDRPYTRVMVEYNFNLIWKRAFPDHVGKTPRLYDFRHHFAWANINRWAREGTDVNTMLPYLMRYMGHCCIKNTLYYFRFVPDFYLDFKNLSRRLNDRIPEVSDE